MYLKTDMQTNWSGKCLTQVGYFSLVTGMKSNSLR